MEWADDGIVLGARRHGESSAIVTLLTRDHGRHAGLVRGATGRRLRGLYQPGNEVTASWRARLAEHLGTLTCELADARAARLIDDPLRLAALSAACSVVEAALPERQPYPELHTITVELLDRLERNEEWAQAFVIWELNLLAELGFGLDLSACAATGEAENLAFVSPRSGRAVSRAAGEPYVEKLLPLPAFILSDGADAPAREDISAGLRLTGWFIAHHVLAELSGALPPARERFATRWNSSE
ncbi:MAG: DNA repair protein RecO [Alphaproteobacteria bacterium]|jgi:DNA repair protein RecO (recombination protein O)|nr:DNA repair protein RecO [Alphaproteobacteria bacterium]